MSLTYLRIELTRLARDPGNLFFTIGLPGVLFLIFGASQDGVDRMLEHGNVALYIMVGMAAYGAITATTTIGGGAAVERSQGWGRQLGLTPLRDHQYVAVKAVTALLIAALPVVVVYALGALTSAEGTARAWALSAVVVLVGASAFALFGLAVGMAFRTEGAVSVAAGLLVVMSFLGNLFVPLDGVLLEIARFSPLYGYAALARRPITDGAMFTSEGVPLDADPLWVPVLNLCVWTLIFGLAAVALVRRGRARQ